MTIRSGTGLDVMINVDRGMDARAAWWRGQPISFSAPVSSYTGGSGTDTWLRRWPGGLLSTCGLRNVGPAGRYEGEDHGQHGRYGSLAARGVRVVGDWEGDTLVSEVAGTVREAVVLGENLECRRTWRCPYGQGRLELTDEIRNAGFREEHVLVLYHVNLGWPLLDETATLSVPSSGAPLNDEATAADSAAPCEPPTAGRPEQVFVHRVEADEKGWAHASLTNRTLVGGVRFNLAWRPDQLPYLIQWRSQAAGAYALGLEPANCQPTGRSNEIANGRGDVLTPGETKRIDIRLTLEETIA